MERINRNDDMGVIPKPLQAEGRNNTNGLVPENDLVLQEKEEALLLGKIRELPPMTRREFLRGLIYTTSAAVLAACAPKPVQNTGGNFEKHANTQTAELEKYAYVRDPKRLNTNDFIKGVEDFPSAIVERSPFATNDRGEPLFIRYGGQFREVTYLHFTGQKPPGVGEIIPLMYKVPTNTQVNEIEAVPYAISTGSASKKVDLNDGMIHYVVPIVTTGTNNGIVQKIENGQVVNQVHQPFEVVPDSVSRSSKGFLSWAVLTEIGNEVVVEGVASSNCGVYIDSNNVPSEVSEIIGN
jgi:hypothetical protein